MNFVHAPAKIGDEYFVQGLEDGGWWIPDENTAAGAEKTTQQARVFNNRDAARHWYNQNREARNAYAFIYDQPAVWYHVNRLAHDTDGDSADSIENDGGFRPSPKLCGNETYRLVWFHMQLHRLNDRVGNTNPPFVQNRSVVFDNGVASHYGSSRFTIPFATVRDAYLAARNTDTVEYRILGTFMYKQELMHALVVCTPGDLDDLDLLGEAHRGLVVRQPDGSLHWRCHSASARSRQGHYRFWLHLSLAFYFPSEQPEEEKQAEPLLFEFDNIGQFRTDN